MSADRIGLLENAVDKAASKGARESLVLLNDLAVLVSVRNRTVITAMERENMKEGVFTQIDSAVIV
jgi:flagellar operon protein